MIPASLRAGLPVCVWRFRRPGIAYRCRAVGFFRRYWLPDGLGPPAVSAGYCLCHHRGGWPERHADGVGGESGLFPTGVLAATSRRTPAWKPQASWRALPLPIVLLALWQLASQWGWIDSGLFSRRWRWRHVLFRDPERRAERRDAGQSGRAVVGGALGIAGGLLCGLLLALRPRAGQILPHA